jgi:hypothetical protein
VTENYLEFFFVFEDVNFLTSEKSWQRFISVKVT